MIMDCFAKILKQLIDKQFYQLKTLHTIKTDIALIIDQLETRFADADYQFADDESLLEHISIARPCRKNKIAACEKLTAELNRW